MNKTIKLIGDRVLLLKSEPATQTQSGIMLPYDASDENPFGRIVAVSPEVEDSVLKVGNLVFYDAVYGHNDFRLLGTDYILTTKEHIIGQKLKDEESK